MNNVNILKDLFDIVSRYYPVKVGTKKNNFGGDKEYAERIEKKISELLTQTKTQWSLFIKNVGEIRGSGSVLNMDYIQFPSYVAEIELESKRTAAFLLRRNLVVSVSLLGNYYTFFFEDKYTFLQYTNGLIKPECKIVFLNTDLPTPFEENMLFVKKNLEFLFPAFDLIDFRILFRNTVDNVCLYIEGTDSEPKTHNLYNLLFDPFYRSKEMIVVE